MPSAEIMKNAYEDLSATVEGRFSPEDWASILTKAEHRLTELELEKSGWSESERWHEVMREFRRERYWGYRPTYRAPRIKKKSNLGYSFIWITFNTLTTMKVAVLWFGQIYSRSDEPKDKWIFFLLLIFCVGNFVFFLWRNRNHVD